MATPGLRDLYNRFEQVASPLAIQVTRTEEFATFAALLAGVNKTVRTEVDKLQASFWRAVNLPAGTDVQRLQAQLGALDREVRLLTLELASSRANRRAVNRRGVSSGSVHDRPGPS